MEPPHLVIAGARWFHTDDHCTVHLNRSSLGIFMYETLKIGAYVGEIWPFNPHYDHSAVYFTVFMTEAMRDELELKFRGRVKFKDPPVISLT